MSQQNRPTLDKLKGLGGNVYYKLKHATQPHQGLMLTIYVFVLLVLVSYTAFLNWLQITYAEAQHSADHKKHQSQ